MIIYALLAVFGLLFGSFYLVVATRLPNEESIVAPGSHCDNCKHILKWYELIPVISYIIQGGKCRKCGAKIPLITVLIEVLTACTFCISYYLYHFNYGFFALIILLSLTIIIFISDFKYYIISDEPLIAAILLILTFKYRFFGLKALLLAILSGAILFLVFLTIKYLGDKSFKRESLGGGDVKLAILIGATLGIKLGLTSFILAAFIAFPYAIFVSLFKKEAIVPFGPFLISALVIVFVYMNFFVDLINKLFVF